MSTFTNPRVLHTNFYSLEFKHLLDQFFSRIKNSSKKRMRRNGHSMYLETEVAADGEILINFNTNEYGWYKTTYAKKKTDDSILDWIGWMMKVMTHEIIEHDKWQAYLPYGDKADYRMIDLAKKAAKKAHWKRDSDVNVWCFSTSKMSVHVKDIYFIYDALKNRKGCDRHYDEAIVKRWRGQKKDPLATEMEVARRAEVERINTEYKNMIEDWNTDYRYGVIHQSKAWNELQQLITDFKDKCKAERIRLQAERDEKLKELEALCYVSI